MRFWLVTVVVLFTMGAAPPTSSPSAVQRLDSNSTLYRAALPHVVKWREAIVARDILGFVSYAYPEDRDWLAVTLSNQKSTQYQYAFSSWEKSLRNQLLSRDRVVLFEEIDMPLSGKEIQYVTACYISESETLFTWPADSGALKETTESAGIPCQLFMHARDQWFAEVGALNGWY